MTDADIARLRNPWMVAAFEGWNDAADAATSTVDHLLEEWDAEIFAELDPQEFYDFQAVRPVIAPSENGTRDIVWPTPTLYLAHPPRQDRDVLLLRAVEPNYRWQAFCATVVDLAQAAGVHELITLGALLADTPHTRPVPVTGSTNDPVLMERLSLDQSRYSGPIGITTVLSDVAARAGLATAGIWAAVPHYVAEPPCYKATLGLLGALEDAIGVGLPQGVLREMSDAWQRGADDLMEQDEDLLEYVRTLENERDAGEPPEASGDAIAREFERYLRRRPTEDS
ncbi:MULTISPECIES: PAC2 family protein [Aeromicrobium]|uniref:Proteasome assembly chaperone (PAC2) family protein n=2 Tax=Aeromicrobium tamlense TaxID=375541 RepID=A0ABX2SFY6_9ACTN|nr:MULTISPECIES: PAC2 family protein [Aeromicrobium]NYI37816.1 proteasome assembly chaperone (PAC2) family protein [Aeromicrobium tamlense]